MPTWYKFWARTGPNVSIISSISTAPPRFEACVQSRAPGWWPPTHCLPSDSGWVRSSRFTQYRFPKARLSRLTKGPELSFFSVLGIVFGAAVLSVLLAICSILELEAAIQTVSQHFGVRTSHFPWYLQHFGTQTFHAGWYLAARCG